MGQIAFLWKSIQVEGTCRAGVVCVGGVLTRLLLTLVSNVFYQHIPPTLDILFTTIVKCLSVGKQHHIEVLLSDANIFRLESVITNTACSLV